MHEWFQFPCTYCTYCTYETTTNGALAKHWKESHKGVKYPCKHCSYELTPKGELKGHQKSVHEEFKYHTNNAVLKQL